MLGDSRVLAPGAVARAVAGFRKAPRARGREGGKEEGELQTRRETKRGEWREERDGQGGGARARHLVANELLALVELEAQVGLELLLNVLHSRLLQVCVLQDLMQALDDLRLLRGRHRLLDDAGTRGFRAQDRQAVAIISLGRHFSASGRGVEGSCYGREGERAGAERSRYDLGLGEI